MPNWQRIKVLVTVTAYPSLSLRSGESVCVAGIRLDTSEPAWVRLYPMDLRGSSAAVRIRKWDVIEVDVTPALDDHRTESRKPRMDTIEVVGHLGTDKGWAVRRSFVEPLILPTYAKHLAAAAGPARPSLAAVRFGELLALEVEKRAPADLEKLQTKAEAIANRLSLFDDALPDPAEPIPWSWYVTVKWPDEGTSHRLKLIDWEICQQWRRERHKRADAHAYILEHWRSRVFGEKSDVTLFLGNQHRFQDQWLLLGVFWPPKRSEVDDGQAELGFEL